MSSVSTVPVDGGCRQTQHGNAHAECFDLIEYEEGHYKYHKRVGNAYRAAYPKKYRRRHHADTGDLKNCFLKCGVERKNIRYIDIAPAVVFKRILKLFVTLSRKVEGFDHVHAADRFENGFRQRGLRFLRIVCDKCGLFLHRGTASR